MVPRARRPAVSRLAWLLVRDPAGLGDADRALLGQLHTACPMAATAYPLLQTFVRMVRARTPEPLDVWLTAASTCGVPDVASFAEGLRREHAALRAALTLPWSTGPVEGQITRLKLIKRQGDGRSGLDTLKRRFIHTCVGRLGYPFVPSTALTRRAAAVHSGSAPPACADPQCHLHPRGASQC